MARLLYLGCEPGLDVSELQESLNNACLAVGEGSAFAALTVDSLLGSKTQSRVLEFQRQHQLNADGIVGARTWAMLEAVLITVPGLEVRRPLGGGGNPGAGPGAQGGSAYGKPGGKTSGPGHDSGAAKYPSGGGGEGGWGGGGGSGGSGKWR